MKEISTLMEETQRTPSLSFRPVIWLQEPELRQLEWRATFGRKPSNLKVKRLT